MSKSNVFFFSVPSSVAPVAAELRNKMKRSAIKSRQPIGRVFIEIAAESEKLREKAAEELEKLPEGGVGRERLSIGVPEGAEAEIAEARERIALLGCDLYTTAGKAFVALLAAYYADKP